MQTKIDIAGKEVRVITTSEADAILSHRELPLTVEMELYFSCLICKKVKFYPQEQDSNDDVSINDKLSVRFRPVTTKTCKCTEENNNNVIDFPIVKKQPYIPKWLKIDFRFGHWYGEFGYLAS